MEEKKRKTELGHIYSCRISKSGKYLNLIVSVNVGEEIAYVCVPVPFDGYEREGHPYAEKMDLKEGYAKILNLKVFNYEKPAEKPAEKAKDEEIPF